MARRSNKTVPTAAAPSRPTRKPADKASAKDRVAVFVNGVRVELSAELEAAVHRAYKGLCDALPAEMTTTQAADFLDVSRPLVVKLIKRGELPCRMVGSHHRIPSAALVAYRDKMFRRANQAADELTRLSQELGLYQLEGRPPNGR